jgi:hypothetical protein
MLSAKYLVKNDIIDQSFPTMVFHSHLGIRLGDSSQTCRCGFGMAIAVELDQKKHVAKNELLLVCGPIDPPLVEVSLPAKSVLIRQHIALWCYSKSIVAKTRESHPFAGSHLFSFQ